MPDRTDAAAELVGTVVLLAVALVLVWTPTVGVGRFILG